jgi:hypothetical protein
VSTNRRIVDSGYFDVLGVDAIRGRLFDERDRPGSDSVVVVSASFAHGMYGDENPLGRPLDDTGQPTIIGIVPDLRYTGFADEARPAVYFPAAQRPSELVCLVVRATAGTPGLGAALVQAVHDTDPTVPAMKVAALDDIMGDSIADRRFYTAATTVFSAFALILAAAGVVVVIARGVVERRREMAIRSALGATRSGLVQLISRQALGAVTLGLLSGLGAAWLATGLLRPFLFGVAPDDARVFLVAAGLTSLSAVVASLIPARAVTAISPASVLRGD